MGTQVPKEIMAGNFTGLQEAPKHKFKTLKQSQVGEIKSIPSQVISIVPLQKTKDKVKTLKVTRKRMIIFKSMAPLSWLFCRNHKAMNEWRFQSSERNKQKQPSYNSINSIPSKTILQYWCWNKDVSRQTHKQNKTKHWPATNLH